MANKIPILDLKPEIQSQWGEFTQAMETVLRSGQFVSGPQGEAFEKEAALYLGAQYAVAVNSGTDALVIALRSLGIGPGDEVVTTPFSFFATAEAITVVGAKPVFVDIDIATFNLDPNLIEAAITPRTKAIMPVHLFGQSAENGVVYEVAKKYSLRVLEDAAQSFGAEYEGKKVGGVGDTSTFSFFPTKNLGAFGDAGLITTNDPAVATEARRLRNHGSSKRYYHDEIGYCSRLDELQAAILRVKLPHIDKKNELRREAAQRYHALLGASSRIHIPVVSPRAKPIFHQYTVRIEGGMRDTVFKKLAGQGISTMIYYPVPIHRSPVYDNEPRDLPRAEQAAREVLSLPIWPEIDAQTQKTVAERLFEALGL